MKRWPSSLPASNAKFAGLGFGIGLGAAITFEVAKLFTAAQAGDKLSFFGALLGAAITVIGSVIVVQIIEETKDKRERQARRRLLDELLTEIEEIIARVENPSADEHISAAMRQKLDLQTLNDRIVAAQNARQWITPDNAAMIRAFGLIGKMQPSQELIDRVEAALFYNNPAKIGDLLMKTAVEARLAKSELSRQ